MSQNKNNTLPPILVRGKKIPLKADHQILKNDRRSKTKTNDQGIQTGTNDQGSKTGTNHQGIQTTTNHQGSQTGNALLPILDPNNNLNITSFSVTFRKVEKVEEVEKVQEVSSILAQSKRDGQMTVAKAQKQLDAIKQAVTPVPAGNELDVKDRESKTLTVQRKKKINTYKQAATPVPEGNQDSNSKTLTIPKVPNKNEVNRSATPSVPAGNQDSNSKTLTIPKAQKQRDASKKSARNKKRNRLDKSVSTQHKKNPSETGYSTVTRFDDVFGTRDIILVKNRFKNIPDNRKIINFVFTKELSKKGCSRYKPKIKIPSRKSSASEDRTNIDVTQY